MFPLLIYLSSCTAALIELHLLFGKAVTMKTIRKEVVAYVRACEFLLSTPINPALNQNERDLIAYYVEELARQYDPNRSGKVTCP